MTIRSAPLHGDHPRPRPSLRAADWNRRLAAVLAHQLARLHEALATGTAPSAAFVPSAGEQGEELLTWWGAHQPETLADPRVRALLPAWRRELTRLAPAFETVATHPLIHGDAVATNVVLGPDGLPRLIDFEWSGPGDIAKDLALIGGRVTGGPWYLPMTSDDVTAFVTEYSRYSRYSRRSRLAQDAGATDPQRMLDRRDGYELLDRLGQPPVLPQPPRRDSLQEVGRRARPQPDCPARWLSRLGLKAVSG